MGKRYETQYEPGTVIGEMVCLGHDCTKVLPVKIGKSDKAYVYCLQDRGTQAGGCGFRGYFGRESSDAMILAWEKANDEKANNVQTSEETDTCGTGKENGNGAGSGDDAGSDGDAGSAGSGLWFDQ